MKKINCLLGSLVVFCLGLGSCSKLVAPELVAVVSREVTIVPEFSKGVATPEKLNVLIYLLNGTLYKEYALSGDGGVVTAPTGACRLVVYTPEATSVTFSGQDKFETASGRVLPLGKAQAEYPSPGPLSLAINYLPESELPSSVKPKMIERNFLIDIRLNRLVDGSEYKVSLINLADGLSLSTGKAIHIDENSKEGFLQFAESKNAPYGEIILTGRTFGGCSMFETCSLGGEHKILARVDVKHANGKSDSYQTDVSQAVSKAQGSPNTMFVKITMLEERIQISSTVGEWTSGIDIVGAVTE